MRFHIQSPLPIANATKQSRNNAVILSEARRQPSAVERISFTSSEILRFWHFVPALRMTKNRLLRCARNDVLFFIVILLLAYPVLAQDAEQEFCTAVAKYQSGGADYVPGVDVHGKPVVGADLNSGMKPMFDPVVIPIEIDIAERFGLELPEGMAMKPEIAHVKIYSDGRVEYNDTDVTKDTETMCSSAKVAEPAYNPQPAPPSSAPASSQAEEVQPQASRIYAPAGEAASVPEIEREAAPEIVEGNKGNGQGAGTPVTSPSEYGPVIEGESE